MATQYSLRAMKPTDGAGLQRLMENDPEEPGMMMTTRFRVDPYKSWEILKPGMLGVVAEAPGESDPVGCATVSFEEVQFEGRVLPAAFLENFKVHHAYRGKGIAKQLALWCVVRARERHGDDMVIVTGMNSSNTASLATMKSWYKQVFSPMKLIPRPTRNDEPPAVAGIQVRAVQGHDLAEVAEKSNRFYANYNLYAPMTDKKLAALLKITPSVYHYSVAVDANDHVLAGMFLTERSRLMVDEFRNAPEGLSSSLPPDQLLRLLEVTHAWFDDLSAGQYLWEKVCLEFRNRVNTVSVAYDARGALKDLFIPPPEMPKIEMSVPVSGPTMMDSEKLVANFVRG